MSHDVIYLNVGGTKYITSRGTLTKYPGSLLGAMFSNNLQLAPAPVDQEGNYFIDGNGSIFTYILQFLRRGTIVFPTCKKELQLLEMEADFYGIKPLIQLLQERGFHVAHEPNDLFVITITSLVNYDQESEYVSFICQRNNGSHLFDVLLNCNGKMEELDEKDSHGKEKKYTHLNYHNYL